MRYEEIDALIRRFEESSLSVLEYEEDAYRVRLEQKGNGSADKTGGPSGDIRKEVAGGEPEKEPATEAEEKQAIRSPIIGTFYSAPSPDEPPFVQEGDTVKAGDVVGIVEAMKVMNEIKAPFDCRITEVQVADGAMVEVGSALFEVEPC